MPVLRPLTDAHTATRRRATFLVKPEQLVVVAESRQRHVFAVDVADWSIYAKHLAPHADLLDDRDAVTLSYLLYRYALRTANTKHMRKWTRVDKSVVVAARESLFAHAHLVQYKIATLRCVVDRLDPRTDLSAIARHFEACGLRATDAVLFALLHYNGDIGAFVDVVAGIPDATFSLEVRSLEREADDPALLRELNKTAGYFTHRKLKFIVLGNRLDYSDVHGDLRERGIQAYYWVRPFYSVEHAINYAKRAIYKHAMNTIAYYNDPARARTYQIGDTGEFSNTVVQFSEYLPGPVETVNHTEDALIEWLDRSPRHA